MNLNIFIKKRFTPLSLLVILQFITFQISYSQNYAGGDGSENNPYQISTWHHLDNVRLNLISHFILINDLSTETSGYSEYASPSANLNNGWLPLPDFSGKFNGNNHSITGLTINRTTNDASLFKSITNSGKVENLILTNVNIKGAERVGAITAQNFGLIENCHVSGTVESSTSTDFNNVGGIAGRNAINNGVGVIKNSSSSATIIGNKQHVGGITGVTRDGARIENCYSTGDITAAWGRVGGISGGVGSTSEIKESFAAGTITSNGNLPAGGLVGNFNGSIYNSYATANVNSNNNIAGGLVGLGEANSLIFNSYATGEVSGATIGGFIGELNENAVNNAISNSFWDVNASGVGNEGDTNFNALGKTTPDLKAITTFTNVNWDFDDVWAIKEAESGFISYPYLKNIVYDAVGVTPEINPIPGLTEVEVEFAGGDGSENNPYQISTWQNLHWVSQNSSSWNKHFIQTTDIDISEIGPSPASSEWIIGSQTIEVVSSTTGTSSNGLLFRIVGATQDSEGNSLDTNSPVRLVETTDGVGQKVLTIFALSEVATHNNVVTLIDNEVDFSATLTSGSISEILNLSPSAIISAVTGLSEYVATITLAGETITYTTTDTSQNGYALVLSGHLNSGDPQVYVDSENNRVIIAYIPDETTFQELNLLADLNTSGGLVPISYFSQTILTGGSVGIGWIPIGNNMTKFTGSYNGNGHTISNLFINRPDENYVGLFGYTSNALIKGIQLINTTVTGGENTGGLIGLSNNSDTEDVQVTGNITGATSTGGVIGFQKGKESSIKNASFQGNVTGDEAVGGLVGKNYGSIATSMTNANVTGNFKVGGLVGLNEKLVDVNLVVNVEGMGAVSITPDLVNYESNSEVVLNATPSTNWGFVNWSGDYTGTENPLHLILNTNKNITANFTQVAFLVQLNRLGFSSGSSEITATLGEAMPSANPPNSYAFLGYFSEPNGEGTQYYDSAMNSLQNWDIPESTTLYAFYDFCLGTPCQNNGVCTSNIELLTFTCECPGGFMGDRCQHIDACFWLADEDPCGGFGTCISDGGGIRCDCNPGQACACCNGLDVFGFPCTVQGLANTGEYCLDPNQVTAAINEMNNGTGALPQFKNHILHKQTQLALIQLNKHKKEFSSTNYFKNFR